MSRSRTLVLLLFVAGVAAHAAWMAEWVAADERVSGSICCDLSGPVVDLVVSERTGYRTPLSPWRLHDRGGMSWLAFAVSEVQGGFSPDTLLWTQMLALGAAQAAMLWALWPIAGPWGALAAALCLPLLPGIAFAARSWAPFTIQSALLIVSLGAAVRGLDRLRWAAVLVVTGFLGASTSRLITDDLLFVQSLGLMLAASVIAAAVHGQTATARRVSRWRLALGTLLTAGLMLGAIAHAFSPRGDVRFHLSYYAEELGVQASEQAPTYASLADPRSAEALMAYPRRLSNYEVGVLWTGLLLLALPGFVLRGRGRAALLTGGLGPLLILTLVAKKQIFYVYLILPFIPAFVAIGLVGPLRRRPRAAAVAAALLVGVAVWGIDTDKPPPGSSQGTVRQWQRAVFQFPYPLTLYPQVRTEAGGSEAYLSAVLPQSCPSPLGLVVLDNDLHGALGGEPELAARLKIVLAEAGMCVSLYRQLPDDGTAPAVLWVGGDRSGSCQVSAEQPWSAAWAQAYRALDWAVVDQRTLADGRCRTLLVRDDSRWLGLIRDNVAALSD